MKRNRIRARRLWRNFKYKLAQKLYPNEDLSFLFDPVHFGLGLIQMRGTETYKRNDYERMATSHIKEVLASQMIPNLIDRIEYEVVEEGDNITCYGELTIAERRAV